MVKNRLGKKGYNINWLCQDIALPLPPSTPPIDIWFDRAVLHFLINEENINGYFDNVKTFLNLGGHVLFAEFSKKGAFKCAGLPVHQYSIEELSSYLGSSFQLINHTEWVFINPKGEPRPYIYALFKKIKIADKIHV